MSGSAAGWVWVDRGAYGSAGGLSASAACALWDVRAAFDDTTFADTARSSAACSHECTIHATGAGFGWDGFGGGACGHDAHVARHFRRARCSSC